MRLLFVVSTEGRLRDVMGLSEATVRRRDDVTVFFNEDSVKLLRRPSLVESLYADILACRLSAKDQGVGKEDMVANARISSLAELVLYRVPDPELVQEDDDRIGAPDEPLIGFSLDLSGGQGSASVL